jgi:hypothetical protein
MFNILFPLDRSDRSIVLFVIHQHLHSIPPRKPFDQALAVFVNTADQIIRHADVQRTS